MGILDDILSPVKDIINSLEKPVHVVEGIFGEIIKFTKEIIETLIEMIHEIESLFNKSEIETIFLAPFKDAALVAVGSVKLLLDLLAPFAPNTEGSKELIMAPIEDAYSLMKDSFNKVKDEVKIFISEIESESLELVTGTNSKFESFLIKVESIPSSIKQIADKLKDNFKVETGKIFDIESEYNPYTKTGNFITDKKIKQRLTTNVESYANVEEKISARIHNEHAALDTLYLVLFFVIVGMLGVIYYVTRSLLPIVVLLGIIIIAIILYMIFELLIKPIFGSNLHV